MRGGLWWEWPYKRWITIAMFFKTKVYNSIVDTNEERKIVPRLI